MLKRKKIKELGEIVNGGTPSTKVEEYWDGNIPWITPNDLSQNRDKWIESGERNITEFGVENSNAKLIPANSIMISTRAPVGYVVRNKVDATTNQGIKSFVPNTELVDADYMYYFFVKNIKLLNMRSGGTTFRELSTTSLKNLEVKIPDIEMQKEISGRISVFDDKISLNNELISSLEEYSQLIFHKWFVDFNFPNEEGKPYKDNGGEMYEVDGKMIPVGWKLGYLGDIIQVSSGKRCNISSEVIDENNYIPVYGASGIIGYTNEFLNNEPIIVTGRVGTHGVIMREKNMCWPSDNTLVIKPKHYEFVYHALQKINFKKMNIGSIQPLLTQTKLKRQKVVIPNKIILNLFEEKVSILYIKIEYIKKENQLLEETRDLLIKKLIK